MKTQYAADKPSDCRYCYYWKNTRKGCSLGKANCYYQISPPPKSKSDCDGCPYGRAHISSPMSRTPVRAKDFCFMAT